MKRYALIVAGGSGVRMGANVPKQFIPLCGRPLLMHTLALFASLDNAPEILVALPEEHAEGWKSLCANYRFEVAHSVVTGGETRFHSVKNGLSAIPSGNSLVAIHDGVRPLVSPAVIERCFSTAIMTGNAAPAVNPVDSVRLSENGDTYPLRREAVYLVQTPQVFLVSVIKECYKMPYQASFTDDASVAEFCGHRITLVEGNRENIKITTPTDLLLAELIMKNEPLWLDGSSQK